MKYFIHFLPKSNQYFFEHCYKVLSTSRCHLFCFIKEHHVDSPHPFFLGGGIGGRGRVCVLLTTLEHGTLTGRDLLLGSVGGHKASHQLQQE